MSKPSREFWARLLLGLWLFLYCLIGLAGLTFDSIKTFMLLLAGVDGVLWILTVFP